MHPYEASSHLDYFFATFQAAHILEDHQVVSNIGSPKTHLKTRQFAEIALLYEDDRHEIHVYHNRFWANEAYYYKFEARLF
jgi:hypothetical protein